MVYSSLGKTVANILEAGNNQADWEAMLRHPSEHFRTWAVTMITSSSVLAKVVSDTAESLHIRQLALSKLRVFHIEEMYTSLHHSDPLRKQPVEWYIKKHRLTRNPQLRVRPSNSRSSIPRR